MATPPIPKAISSPSEPVEVASISGSAFAPPNLMIAPLPN
ncbi:hypothetical protein EIO_1477 [Ketogulonicigenium vulgare Y25]|nr:hypothetical protein EIO_1477 [Ketogulonicigenium vulgare Y25]